MSAGQRKCAEWKHPALAVARWTCAESRHRDGSWPEEMRRLQAPVRLSCAHGLLMHRTPQQLITPMSRSTTPEVLALVVGSHASARFQRIIVETRTVPHFVLHNPTAFFPGNAHPHRMLGGVLQESYCIFLDLGANNCHSKDRVYVIVKVDRATRVPIDVDPSTVVPKAEILLQK